MHFIIFMYFLSPVWTGDSSYWLIDGRLESVGPVEDTPIMAIGFLEINGCLK
jgi:hypothetical protein